MTASIFGMFESNFSGIPHMSVPAKCGQCHEDVYNIYIEDIHWEKFQTGETKIPVCTDCHETHNIRPSADPDSSTYVSRIPELCGKCHIEKEIVTKTVIEPYTAYKNSVHGRRVSAGLTAAVCSNCHDMHDIRQHTDPKSSTNRMNIPATCSKCHLDIFLAFNESIHWRAALAGVNESPVCTDCHGEHRILPPADPKSQVYATTVSLVTCPSCHASQELVEEYNIPPEKVESYLDSYHGLAAQAGFTTVAQCSSCHGIHSILPSNNPYSTINPKNLPTTCGRCHPEGKYTPSEALKVVHTKELVRRPEIIDLFFKVLTTSVIIGLLSLIALDVATRIRVKSRKKIRGKINEK